MMGLKENGGTVRASSEVLLIRTTLPVARSSQAMPITKQANSSEHYRFLSFVCISSKDALRARGCFLFIRLLPSEVGKAREP